MKKFISAKMINLADPRVGSKIIFNNDKKSEAYSELVDYIREILSVGTTNLDYINCQKERVRTLDGIRRVYAQGSMGYVGTGHCTRYSFTPDELKKCELEQIHLQFWTYWENIAFNRYDETKHQNVNFMANTKICTLPIAAFELKMIEDTATEIQSIQTNSINNFEDFSIRWGQSHACK